MSQAVGEAQATTNSARIDAIVEKVLQLQKADRQTEALRRAERCR